MNLKMVINLFGGPGIGKSTIAASLFSQMKVNQFNVELITEYAKELTWEKRHNILKEDQLYVFAKQHRKLIRVKDHVDYAICDSPLLLSYLYYNPEYNMYDETHFRNLVVNTFDKYPNLNIVLRRNDTFEYQNTGRNQSLVEAKLIDYNIEKFLDLNLVKYWPVTVGESTTTDILNLIAENQNVLC